MRGLVFFCSKSQATFYIWMLQFYNGEDFKVDFFFIANKIIVSEKKQGIFGNWSEQRKKEYFKYLLDLSFELSWKKKINDKNSLFKHGHGMRRRVSPFYVLDD